MSRPATRLMVATCVVVLRRLRSGYVWAPAAMRPGASSYSTRTGSTVNGCSQCRENRQTIVFKTISALAMSTAVHSMKQFRVSLLILLCSLLMMGGSDSTVSSLSVTTWGRERECGAGAGAHRGVRQGAGCACVEGCKCVGLETRGRRPRHSDALELRHGPPLRAPAGRKPRERAWRAASGAAVAMAPPIPSSHVAMRQAVRRRRRRLVAAGRVESIGGAAQRGSGRRRRSRMSGGTSSCRAHALRAPQPPGQGAASGEQTTERRGAAMQGEERGRRRTGYTGES